MATWLTLTNQLQRRLREIETSSVTTNTYSTLLGELINQGKREVEDEWDWHVLRTVLSFTTSSGTADYTITGSTERSRFFSPSREMYDDTNDSILKPAPDWWIDRQTFLGTTQNNDPSWYRMRGISSGALQLTFYPTPGSTLTIQVPMVVPQADLAVDGTTLTVPADPVVMRAYVLALQERGEDRGTAIVQAESMASGSLFSAIMIDREFNPDEGFATVY